MSKKFFGNENPIGRLLSTDFATFTVTGVLAEIPETSHFHFKVVFPLSSWWPDADQSRNMYAFYSYVRLKSASDIDPFTNKTLKDWYKIYGYVNERGESTLNDDVSITLGARRLQDLHLRSHAEKEYESNGHLHLVYIFLAVAILILVIAMINYVNLSNAMAMKRAREIGVKKTMGASWQGLFVRFLLESCAFTFLAFIISFILLALVMPQFNLITGKNFQLMQVMDIRFFLAAFAGWLTIGLMAGTYPAIILSSFNPIHVLKSGTNIVLQGGKSLQFSHGLIILQFIISSLLIICTLTIREQIAFIEGRDVGFNKSNVLLIPFVGAARQDAERIKTALSELADVESCAATSVAPGQRVVFLNVRIPDLAGNNETVAGTDDGSRDIRVMGVDPDFVVTLELTITDGRDFSIENAADEQEGFLINEAAVRAFGLTDPVGRPFEYLFGDQPKKGKIIGIVKDFNFASIHSPVDPLMMHIFPPFWSMLCVRLKPDYVKASVRAIEAKWTTITSVPFGYTFLDTTYDMMYRSEQTSGKVIAGLTFVALFIACLGLFAIVSFFVGQRTREVGLRKVLGATQASLFKTLSRKYLILVIVGNFIAFCPAWLMTDEWLRQFAYRIDLSPAPFILAMLISLALTIISMFYVVLKTVRINPASILRHE